MHVALPDLAVVVPTYWTRAGGKALPGDSVYDHPTPIDGEGTLGRLLESLASLRTSGFYVLVLVATTCTEVEPDARRRVENIANGTPGPECLIISALNLPHVAGGTNGRMAGRLLGFSDYSRVRNVQLAAPLAMGARVIVALDDDEIVTEPDFLERARGAIGSTVDGATVDGVGGYYVQDRDGRTLLDQPPGAESASNLFDRKAAIMNAAAQALEAMPGRIVRTPFCFGGNMVFSQNLAASVCFDPSITRGEDIDYLINARLAGYPYFMDKDLRILHDPPAGGSYKDMAYHKVVQDVLRFVYEREKLAAWADIGAEQPLSAKDLDPYPGQFLDSRLDGDAEEVITRIFDQTDREQRAVLGLGLSPDSFMREAHKRARKGIKEYAPLQHQWRQLTHNIMNDTGSRDRLLGNLRERTTAEIRV